MGELKRNEIDAAADPDTKGWVEIDKFEDPAQPLEWLACGHNAVWLDYTKSMAPFCACCEPNKKGT